MLFALLYLLLRRLLRLIAGSSNDLDRVELAVLRHQLMVLKRQVDRPRFRRRDRLFIAAFGRLLPVLGVVVPGQPADGPSVAPGIGEEEVDVQAELL